MTRMLQLRQIVPLDGSSYEVTFDGEDGVTKNTVCRVFKHKGVWGVQMKPDLIMSGAPPRIESRKLVTAILTYHRQCTH